MKVICISGKARHGKDTTANIMRDLLESEGYKVLICHYGDLVKYICKTFFDWDGVKDEYGRTLLQNVGTDVVRSRQPDYWVDFITGILELFNNEWDYVLIPDTRFPNECDRVAERFDAVTLRVERPDFDNGLTCEQKKHPSETSLDYYDFDYVIVNDGNEHDLEHMVSDFIKEIYDGENDGKKRHKRIRGEGGSERK